MINMKLQSFVNSRQFGERLQEQYQKYLLLFICLFISDSSFCVGACFILILALVCLLQAAETRLTPSKYNVDNKVGLN